MKDIVLQYMACTVHGQVHVSFTSLIPGTVHGSFGVVVAALY